MKKLNGGCLEEKRVVPHLIKLRTGLAKLVYLLRDVRAKWGLGNSAARSVYEETFVACLICCSVD